MVKYDYTDVYTQIIHFVKSHGVGVQHRKLKDIYGQFNTGEGTITMSTMVRNTHRGCFALVHEYIHSRQYRNPKYHAFFHIPENVPMEKQERWLKLIEKVEIETDLRAQKLLKKKWGLWHTANDVVEDRPHYRQFWRKFYWGE